MTAPAPAFLDHLAEAMVELRRDAQRRRVEQWEKKTTDGNEKPVGRLGAGGEG